MSEKLVIWEPLDNNPFCSYKNEMHYQKDFVLVFEDNRNQMKYNFTYGQDKAQTYAVISFRFFDELTRLDVHTLEEEFWKVHGK